LVYILDKQIKMQWALLDLKLLLTFSYDQYSLFYATYYSNFTIIVNKIIRKWQYYERKYR